MKSVHKNQVALLLLGLVALVSPKKAKPTTPQTKGKKKKKKSKKNWTEEVISNCLSYLPIVKKYAGPDGLFPTVPLQVVLSVMHPESGGQPDAISWAGAYGLMQLMPATSRGLGLTVGRPPKKSRRDPVIEALVVKNGLGTMTDQRKNPELNIYGGVKLLAELRASQENEAKEYAKKNAANPDKSKRARTSAQIWDRVFAAYNSGNPSASLRRGYIRMVRAAYPFYKDIK